MSPSDVRVVVYFVITAVTLAVGEADGQHHRYSSHVAGVNSVSPPNRTAMRR